MSRAGQVVAVLLLAVLLGGAVALARWAMHSRDRAMREPMPAGDEVANANEFFADRARPQSPARPLPRGTAAVLVPLPAAVNLPAGSVVDLWWRPAGGAEHGLLVGGAVVVATAEADGPTRNTVLAVPSLRSEVVRRGTMLGTFEARPAQAGANVPPVPDELLGAPDVPPASPAAGDF